MVIIGILRKIKPEYMIAVKPPSKDIVGLDSLMITAIVPRTSKRPVKISLFLKIGEHQRRGGLFPSSLSDHGLPDVDSCEYRLATSYYC